MCHRGTFIINQRTRLGVLLVILHPKVVQLSACYRSSIIEYLSENHISAEKLLAVGCDGTNENTGRVGEVKYAVGARTEKTTSLGLQWLICMFHGNELPPTYCRVLMEQHLVRVLFPVHLVNACQHVTVAGNTLCQNNCRLAEFQLKGIQYRPEISMANNQRCVGHEGYCPDDLSKQNPGNLNHSG